MFETISKGFRAARERLTGRGELTEDDRVVAIGTWKIDGQQWDWVQAFRVEGGKLVETWLSGINFAGAWTPDVLH